MFIDRDGEHFRYILNWLRDGVLPSLHDSHYQELLREAEYYQMLVSLLFPPLCFFFFLSFCYFLYYFGSSKYTLHFSVSD